MNTILGRANLEKFWILLDSGFSSMILLGRLVGKIHPDKDAVMQWHKQYGNVTTNHEVKVDYTLPAISATNVVTWLCNVDDYAKGRYNMIWVQYLLTELWLHLKLSEHIIKADDRPFKGSITLMVDFGTDVIKDLNSAKLIHGDFLPMLKSKNYIG